ncbi:hypothetical protein NLI96_g3108 [Meripilus lineatus]|uniref:Uncharacterized protein n=1 Tax=Meripilus lineatus TaxID=2056292 RepID=A0AAD5V711_9APHY|nr:hypothetical protein NLI96_g3108 [Physisporinus lineatus]
MLFLYPLLRNPVYNPEIKRLRLRSFIATIVTSLSSFTHVLLLTILHGREQTWVFTASGSLDILCNSTVVFFLISNTRTDSPTRASEPIVIELGQLQSVNPEERRGWILGRSSFFRRFCDEQHAHVYSHGNTGTVASVNPHPPPIIRSNSTSSPSNSPPPSTSARGEQDVEEGDQYLFTPDRLGTRRSVCPLKACTRPTLGEQLLGEGSLSPR